MTATRLAEPIPQAFLTVPGTLLELQGADVQVYVYADESSRKADTDALDPLTVSPRTMNVLWRMWPSLHAVRNVAVSVLTNDESLRARIRDAIGKS